MVEANALTIAALPADGHGWRIDWFGEIAFPNRMIRRKQPSVLLHLSRVIDERYREDHSVLLNPEFTFVATQGLGFGWNLALTSYRRYLA